MPTQTTSIGELDLLGWKRTIFELYAAIRADDSPESAWLRWRDTRDGLVRDHPCSPLTPTQREAFQALPYYPYDPALRVLATAVPADNADVQIGTSTGEPYRFTRFAHAEFELHGKPQRLALYWLTGYGGGIFLPFADATNGAATYGAGRYLLDTVKGSDLGRAGRPARARLQLRLQPVVLVRPGAGPARCRRPRTGSTSRSRPASWRSPRPASPRQARAPSRRLLHSLRLPVQTRGSRRGESWIDAQDCGGGRMGGCWPWR